MDGKTPGIPGLILAGGQARRMGGGDKALCPLGQGTLLSQVIARLAPQCGPLALSANGDPARFAGFGLPVLADAGPGFAGPLAGVLAGLDWAAGIGAAAMATAAVDTPFLPQDLVVRLRAAGLPAVARGADGRLHPTFALWPVTLRDRLRAALARGEHRVMAFARAEGAALAAFPDTIPDPFFNVNTPDDLARAETLPAPAP